MCNLYSWRGEEYQVLLLSSLSNINPCVPPRSLLPRDPTPRVAEHSTPTNGTARKPAPQVAEHGTPTNQTARKPAPQVAEHSTPTNGTARKPSPQDAEHSTPTNQTARKPAQQVAEHSTPTTEPPGNLLRGLPSIAHQPTKPRVAVRSPTHFYDICNPSVGRWNRYGRLTCVKVSSHMHHGLPLYCRSAIFYCIDPSLALPSLAQLLVDRSR